MTSIDTTFRVAIAGMLAQAGLVYLVPLLTPNQSLVHDYISSSAAVGEPHVDLAFYFGVAGAALHLAFVRSLWDAAKDPWLRASAWLFGAFFVFITASALFQCDTRCALDTNEAFTHFLLGLFSFTSLGLSALAAIIGMARTKPHGWQPVVAIASVVVVADLALLVGHYMHIMPGLAERVTIGSMWAWTIALWRWARTSVPGSAGIPSTAPS